MQGDDRRPDDAASDEPRQTLDIADRPQVGVGGRPRPPRLDAQEAEAPLKSIPRDGYVIEGTFAQGGIGRILRARDRSLRRPVALKELLVADRGETERRFIREALLTARLQHPGIVPIYEAGRWPSGEPFYAMKLLAGRSLFDIIGETSDLDDRLALLPKVLALAEAVAYAHAQGVIHRDLKPENVLVGDFGETVVIDWGLAKDLRVDDRDAVLRVDDRDAVLRVDDRDAVLRVDEPEAPLPVPKDISIAGGDRSRDAAPPVPKDRLQGLSDRPRDAAGHELTVDGVVLGTPAYMPPEQAEGKPVDTRADVYALGSILYHLLTGEPPYGASTAMAIVVKVVTEDPVPVSVKQPGVPSDLAAIVDKAMARDPDARYPTAREFADDLQRFQTGKLVGAHHYSLGERLWRWIRSNRAAIAVAAIALAILTVVGVASLRSVIREKEAARAAEEVARGAEAAARSAEEVATRRADELAVEQARHLASILPGRALDLLAGVVDRTQWRRLRLIAADAHAHGVPGVYVGHRAGISRLAFSPDGALLATTGDDCSLRLWDLRGGTHRVLLGHTDQVWRVAFSADGARVATTSKDATVRIWDARTGAPIKTFVDRAPTRALAFVGPDHLVTSNDETDLKAWPIDGEGATLLASCEATYFFTNGQLIGCLARDRKSLWLGDLSGEPGQVVDVAAKELSVCGALSSDGRYMAACGDRGHVWLWDLSLGVEHKLDAGGRKRVRSLTFSGDGALLAAGTDDSDAYVWRVDTRERLHTLTGADSPVIRIEFSPDGRFLAGVAPEPHIHLWSVDDGRDQPLAGLTEAALAVAFSPDGRQLAGASVDGNLRIWEPGALGSRRLGGPELGQSVAALDPGRPRVATGGSDGVVRLWDLEEGEPRRLGAHARAVSSVVFAADGERFATTDAGGDAKIWGWDGEAIAELSAPAGPGSLRSFLLDPSGARAAAIHGQDVLVWDVSTRTSRVVGRHVGPARGFKISADGRYFLAVGGDRQVMLWDLVGAEHRPVSQHKGNVTTADISRDGALVASGGDEHLIYVRDLKTGEGWTIPTHGLELRELQFHPDGVRAAVIARNNVITLWDLRERAAVRRFTGHVTAVNELSFSADGRTMATVAVDGQVRLWELESGESRTLPGGPEISIAQLSNDARYLLTVARNSNELRVWRDDLPDDADAFFRWLEETRRPIVGPPLPADAAAACPDLVEAGAADGR